MRFREAQKLNMGDEVILKNNGQIYKLLNNPIIHSMFNDYTKRKMYKAIIAIDGPNGFEQFNHWDIM